MHNSLYVPILQILLRLSSHMKPFSIYLARFCTVLLYNGLVDTELDNGQKLLRHARR